MCSNYFSILAALSIAKLGLIGGQYYGQSSSYRPSDYAGVGYIRYPNQYGPYETSGNLVNNYYPSSYSSNLVNTLPGYGYGSARTSAITYNPYAVGYGSSSPLTSSYYGTGTSGSLTYPYYGSSSSLTQPFGSSYYPSQSSSLTGFGSSYYPSQSGHTGSLENLILPPPGPFGTGSFGLGRNPYISRIIEYSPAPGQFVNDPRMGTLEAAQRLIGRPGGNTVTLGNFGGYIVFAFDHPVRNRDGYDLAIYSDAQLGNSEPGIVQVMQDFNRNGIPDDGWYELEGSEHGMVGNLRDYAVTYYNPGPGGRDVPWRDNQGRQGTIRPTGLFNAGQTFQTIFPSWLGIGQQTLTFTGTMLNRNPNQNQFSNYGNLGNYFGSLGNFGTQFGGTSAFKYGYVDNYSDEYARLGYNALDISWAVDRAGSLRYFESIDFVRVYTAVRPDSFSGLGAFGDASTEISGAADLNVLGSFAAKTAAAQLKEKQAVAKRADKNEKTIIQSS